MKFKDSVTTAVTLAAAGELVAEIASHVVGKEVADSVAGAPLNKEMMLSLAQSEFEKTLSAQKLEA